jgi:predicted Zn-dependent protease with MMP-like domain
MKGANWQKLLQAAERETVRTLKKLPPDLRTRAGKVPVVFEPWVSEDLIDGDIMPDILGLFVGNPFDDTDSIDPMPPQIFLFLESIWEAVEGDEQEFLEEVRLTYLHELGHYLGFNEDDVEERGLG